MRAKKISNLVLHCSAGYSSVESIENFWSKTLKWKGKGYHIIIDLDGTTYYLKNGKLKNGYSKDPKDINFNITTNGVLGYNSSTIHICYIGGVEKNNVNKAFDSRTKEQKQSIEKAIQLTLHWLKDNGKDITKNIGLVGHRDFSPDKDGNGIISKWERIKECPSFNVIGTTEHFMYSSKDRYNKLSYVK